jgi:hypothetical protein
MKILMICASIALLWSGVPSVHAQSATDRIGDIPSGIPGWTDILRLSGAQEGKTITFVLETADSIPRVVKDICRFEIVLRTEPPARSEWPTAVLEFELSGWDGSPWFAARIRALAPESGLPADTVRMFDWVLGRSALTMRFSLEGLGWSSLEAKGRVFFKDGVTDTVPDEGWVRIPITASGLHALRTRASTRTVFTCPAKFDSVLARYDVLPVVDAAYAYESDLTGIVPLGGDTVRFVFNPFYGGAAMEGDPIYLGPGMCGKTPLWFVYFHEMGHNFLNASARFGQLYPLVMRLEPGPLPSNVLFYEGWASLPAMYAFDRMERQRNLPGVADSCLRHVQADWHATKTRFAKAWTAYKENPSFTALNPDVLDGMFLELQERFGWDLFRNLFGFLRPTGALLPLFDERLAQDTPDLRSTRATLTAAILSAAARTRLDVELRRWAFPIDDGLFTKAYEALMRSHN